MELVENDIMDRDNIVDYDDYIFDNVSSPFLGQSKKKIVTL